MLVWEEDLKPSSSHKASPAQSLPSQARAVASTPVFEAAVAHATESVAVAVSTRRVNADDKRIINGKNDVNHWCHSVKVGLESTAHLRQPWRPQEVNCRATSAHGKSDGLTETSAASSKRNLGFFVTAESWPKTTSVGHLPPHHRPEVPQFLLRQAFEKRFTPTRISTSWKRSAREARSSTVQSSNGDPRKTNS